MATNDIKHQACGALIFCITTKRYLFLLREKDKHGHLWGIVGGKIEHNETIQQGLYREIQEELGGTIIDAKIIPIEKYTSDNDKFVYHTFLIRVDEEFVPILNHEHIGYAWVKLENCPRPLHPGLQRTFQIKNIKNKLEVLQQLDIKN